MLLFKTQIDHKFCNFCRDSAVIFFPLFGHKKYTAFVIIATTATTNRFCHTDGTIDWTPVLQKLPAFIWMVSDNVILSSFIMFERRGLVVLVQGGNESILTWARAWRPDPCHYACKSCTKVIRKREKVCLPRCLNVVYDKFQWIELDWSDFSFVNL